MMASGKDSVIHPEVHMLTFLKTETITRISLPLSLIDMDYQLLHKNQQSEQEAVHIPALPEITLLRMKVREFLCMSSEQQNKASAQLACQNPEVQQPAKNKRE